MKKQDGRHRPGPRLLSAVGLAGAGLAAMLAAGTLFESCSAESLANAAAIATGGDLEHESHAIEQLPTWFEEELFDGAHAEALYANGDETVFGLVASGSVQDALNRIGEEMAQRGWVRVDGKSEGIASFVREEGPPTWALVSCTGIGADTSIVVCTDGGRT